MKFKVGDVVRLKSGGPLMTVETVPACPEYPAKPVEQYLPPTKLVAVHNAIVDAYNAYVGGRETMHKCAKSVDSTAFAPVDSTAWVVVEEVSCVYFVEGEKRYGYFDFRVLDPAGLDTATQPQTPKPVSLEDMLNSKAVEPDEHVGPFPT